jgi:hypothetical protein
MSITKNLHGLLVFLLACHVATSLKDPATTPVNEWPLVMAHDAATTYSSPGVVDNLAVITQPQGGFQKLLDCGARALDLRVKYGVYASSLLNKIPKWLQPIHINTKMLMFHHGVIDIPKPVSAGLNDVVEWASKHQNGALDMVFLLSSHCEGDQCEQRFEAALKRRGIRTISTTELQGKTVADMVKFSTLPTGGAVLAVLDWDRDGNSNYDENVQCVEAITLQKCFTNSIPFFDSPLGLLHYGPGPLDRMMKYIHKTVEDGPPADGSLWGVQCLWQQSGLAFAALKRGPVKQEEFSGLNKLVTKKIKDGEIDSSKLNIVGVDNVCDGGLGLAAALQKTSIERFTNTGKYAPRVSCNCLTPNAGAAGHNGYRCEDGITGYCSSHQVCVAQTSFIKGDWGKACQITCKCRTPNAGTSGHNGYSCTDGTRGYCSSHQECYADSSFTKGRWTQGCRSAH